MSEQLLLTFGAISSAVLIPLCSFFTLPFFYLSSFSCRFLLPFTLQSSFPQKAASNWNVLLLLISELINWHSDLTISFYVCILADFSKDLFEHFWWSIASALPSFKTSITPKHAYTLYFKTWNFSIHLWVPRQWNFVYSQVISSWDYDPVLRTTIKWTEVVDKATVSFLSPLFCSDLLSPNWNARIRAPEMLKSHCKFSISHLFTYNLEQHFLFF